MITSTRSLSRKTENHHTPLPYSRTNRRHCGAYSSAIFIHVYRNRFYVRFFLPVLFHFFFSEKKKLKLVVAVRANQSITDVQCAAVKSTNRRELQREDTEIESEMFLNVLFTLPPPPHP